MDRTEYERIATQYLDMVYKIALNYTGKAADADDVVQQTFYKMLVKKRSFADEEHIKRWLIRVCINECNSLFSGFWRKNVHFFSEKKETDSETAVSSEMDCEDMLLLCEALRKLPAKCRIVIYLFYYEGYKTQEIAQILHMKEATVRTRLVRGRKLLKEELKEAWEDE